MILPSGILNQIISIESRDFISDLNRASLVLIQLINGDCLSKREPPHLE